jgi:uridine kinase
LRAAGQRVVSFNVDGWLNLPQVRFAADHPAEHFYKHAIRFDDMFAQLALPLQRQRRVHVEVDFAEETATSFRKQTYAFDDTDIVVVEGIYLLKQAYRPYYDLSLWIDCSFETALQRAIARAQEGLPEADTVRAYRSIYFPAQELHFQRDQPRQSATYVIANDPRLATD